MLAARARARGEAGVWAYRQGMVDAEGVIAELKNRQHDDHARSDQGTRPRGSPLVGLSGPR